MSKLYRLLPLLLLIFIDSFSYFVVIPILLKLFYHTQFHLLPASTSLTDRNILTGFTISLAPMAALFFSPFIGFASDQYGRKKTLLLCILCVMMGFALPIAGILFHNLTLILLGRFIAGVGSASQPIAQAAVTDLCDGKDRALYLSFIAFAMTLALVLGPLAGSALIDSHLFYYASVITPYCFALSLSILNLLLILFCFKETKTESNTAQVIHLKSVITKCHPFIKKYKLGFLIIVFCCLELAWSQYYQSIPLFLKIQWHLTTDAIGLFNTLLGITMSIGLIGIFPLFLNYFTTRSILRFSVVLTLIGLIGCNFSTSVLQQCIFANLVSLFTGCAYVSLVTSIADRVDNQHHGLVMGYLSTALYLAWMLTAMMSGFLISWHAKLPLILAAVFLSATLLSSQLWKKD